MASRVTPAEVKAIVTTLLADSIVQIWIDAANSIVNDHEECINGDATLLTQIELYLSAHLVDLLDTTVGGAVTKDKFGPIETTYAQNAASGEINSTVYGNTANMLSKGCLGDVDDTAVSFASLGGDCD